MHLSIGIWVEKYVIAISVENLMIFRKDIIQGWSTILQVVQKIPAAWVKAHASLQNFSANSGLNYQGNLQTVQL